MNVSVVFDRRCASHTGMIEAMTTKVATTFTVGIAFGRGEVVGEPERQRLVADAGRERRDDDLVEGQRKREQSAGDQRTSASAGR